MKRAILVVLTCLCSAGAFARAADDDADRIAIAKRRLEERQRAAATRPAASQPATRPVGAAPAKPSNRVVFVIQASGAMISSIVEVKGEVGKAVSGLKSDQSFGLVAFQDNRAIVFTKTLQPASASNRHQAWTWLNGMTATSTSDPIPALEATAKLRPDVVWFVSNGNMPDNKVALAAAERLSKAWKFRINTVLRFASDDEEAKEFLRELADRTGGICLDENGKPMAPMPKGSVGSVGPEPLPEGPSIFTESGEQAPAPARNH